MSNVSVCLTTLHFCHCSLLQFSNIIFHNSFEGIKINKSFADVCGHDSLQIDSCRRWPSHVALGTIRPHHLPPSGGVGSFSGRKRHQHCWDSPHCCNVSTRVYHLFISEFHLIPWALLSYHELHLLLLISWRCRCGKYTLSNFYFWNLYFKSFTFFELADLYIEQQSRFHPSSFNPRSWPQSRPTSRW